MLVHKLSGRRLTMWKVVWDRHVSIAVHDDVSLAVIAILPTLCQRWRAEKRCEFGFVRKPGFLSNEIREPRAYAAIKQTDRRCFEIPAHILLRTDHQILHLSNQRAARWKSCRYPPTPNRLSRPFVLTSSQLLNLELVRLLRQSGQSTASDHYLYSVANWPIAGAQIQDLALKLLVQYSLGKWTRSFSHKYQYKIAFLCQHI